MTIHLSGPLPRGMRASDVHSAIREAFRVARRKERGEVSVRFVSEKEIAELNLYYAKRKIPTDVLAFPSAVSEPGKKEWGDLFLATKYAARNAKDRAVPLREEIDRLLVHGMLHLFGYDHRTKSEETRMFGLQERAVRRLADRH